MTRKILLSIASSLWLSIVIIPIASTHNGWYLHDSDGNPIRDGNGRCVLSVSGNMIDECEDDNTVYEPKYAPEPADIAPPLPDPVIEIPMVVASQPKPVQPAPVARKTPVKPKVEILNLNESGGSNFTTASSELSINAQTLLTNLVNRISAANIVPSNVTIEGHTDSRGSESYNQKLSLQRAQSVAIYLATLGINPRVIHVAGKGELLPIADNNTKSGRAANRRVAIRVTGQRPVIQ